MATETASQAPLLVAPVTAAPGHAEVEIRFDARQEFQLDAVRAAADLFHGQPLAQERFELRGSFGLAAMTDTGTGNQLALSREQILGNLREVQRRHGLPESAALDRLDFSVEMETGTGKTYVYLRTLYELHARYGFTKFIVVVPSVAVREGVMTSIALMRSHFRELYDRTPIDAWVYDSARLTQVRQFVQSNQLQLMVMNIDAFKTEKTLLRRETDRFSGGTPISMIAKCRPLVVLDEPQNFGSEASVEALRRLEPMATLRYSATHKSAPNLVYRLDPVRAYDLGLVKKIEVDAVLDESDFNKPFIEVESVKPGARIVAKVKLDVAGAKGPVRKSLSVKHGDDLFKLTQERELYRGYVVDLLDAGSGGGAGYVRFSNGVTVQVGAAHGDHRDDVMRVQIRQTIRRHLDKELTVQGFKPGERLKVLSLFFIDRVANYVADDGKIRRWFDQEYETLRKDDRYAGLGLPGAEAVRAAYFASAPKKGGGEEFKDTSGATKADDGAYELIMRNKVRLLSLDEPVRFIFSHSALREGWDNPNVFQICTLNESKSEIKKRQEIGRGLRLPVNERGERSRSSAVNRLTVIANEHYREFADALQKELKEEWSTGKTVPVEDARKRKKTPLKKGWHLDEHFKALWAKISPKTRYSVHFDTQALLEKVVPKLQVMAKVEPVRIFIEGSELTMQTDGIEATLRSTSQVKLDASNDAVPDVLGFLQRKTKLTRSTLAEMLVRSGRLGDLLVNAQSFMDQCFAIIDETLRDVMVSGVKYERLDDAWDMLLFDDAELESYANRLTEVRKSLTEEIELDSDTEREFAKGLDAREDVLFFLKLPRWYRIKTPVGEYNPDWAIVMNDEAGVAKLYLVRETKSTTEQLKLRGVEWAKIISGRAHFKLLGVDFAVVTNAKNLNVGSPLSGLPAEALPTVKSAEPAQPEPSWETVRAYASERLGRLIAVFERARDCRESPDVTPSTEGAFADLTSLLACGALGDGFAALAGALWVSCRHAEWRPPHEHAGVYVEELGVLLEGEPSTRDAFARIERLREKGLDPDIHAFDKLAELPLEGD